MTTLTIAALYIDPRGPYPKMPGVDCWDESRDASGYKGPGPVVAHPPCGPWGAMAPLSRFQSADLGPIAVEQVRRYGGVLEHPAHSRLWARCGLPRPGAGMDEYGGKTLQVNQCDWGHVARKNTWLYVVGAGDYSLPEVPALEPTHWICGSRNRRTKTGGTCPPHIKFCSSRMRRVTPQPFADLLVSIARICRSPRCQ